MSIDPVLPISGPSGTPVFVTAEQWRRLDVATTMAHDSHDVASRAGVTAGLNATVAGLSVTISPGSAVVTPLVSINGSYRVSVSGSFSLNLPARDATYSRHDLIILRVRDSDVDASGHYAATLAIVTGTPSAAPAPPAVPAGALALWVAIVPPSGTVTLVDRRIYTSALGGVITCTSGTRPSGASLRPGQHIFEVDTSVVQVWTGATWQVVSEPVRDYWMRVVTDQAIAAATGTQVTSTALQVSVPAGIYAFDAMLLLQSNVPGGQAATIGWAGGLYSGGVIGAASTTPGIEGSGSYVGIIGARAGTVRAGTGTATSGSPALFQGHVTADGGALALTIGRTNATYQVLLKAGSQLRLRRVS